MKKYTKTALILIISIIITSCEKKATEIDFEKSVLTEIFPSLVDSVCLDSRKMLPPPQFGEVVFDKSGRFVKEDSAKVTKEQLVHYREWQNTKAKIEKDTSSIIIAFDPLLKKRKKRTEAFKKHFSKAEVLQNQDAEEIRFDFENITLNNKFKLMNISNFQAGNTSLWSKKYDFVFSGVLDLSRIQFDKDRKLGVFEAGFVCGGKCGRGFIVLIKKVNGKWVIDKMEQTWVA